MVLVDAPIVKLSEIEQAILAQLPTQGKEQAYLLLELSPQEFIAWTTASPVGIVLALDIIMRHMREKGRALSARDKYAIQRLLWKGRNALRYMTEEINQCISTCE